MAPFHLFPQLPLEMRCQIWALSTPPRDLEICGRPEPLCEEAAEGVDEEDVPLLYFYARDLEIYAEDPVKYQDIRTRTPYALQACHESRAYLEGAGGYVQAFTGGSRPRYTWVNFDVDTIFPEVSFRCTAEEEGKRIRHLALDLSPTELLWIPPICVLKNLRLNSLTIFNTGKEDALRTTQMVSW